MYICEGGNRYEPTICHPIPDLEFYQSVSNPQEIFVVFNTPMNMSQDFFKYGSVTIEGQDPATYNITVEKRSDTTYVLSIENSETIKGKSLDITFYDPNNTRSQDGDLPLSTSSKEIDLNTIEYLSDADKATLDALGEGSSAAAQALAAASGPIMLAGTNPSLMWALLNIIQMLYYLLFINVVYPPNLESFFKIFSMGRLEFLPDLPEIVFGNLTQYEQDAPPKFLDNGLNGFFMGTAGNMIFVWFVTVILYLIVMLIQKFAKILPHNINTLFRKIKTEFEWGIVIRVYISSYIELAIPAFL